MITQALYRSEMEVSNKLGKYQSSPEEG